MTPDRRDVPRRYLDIVEGTARAMTAALAAVGQDPASMRRHVDEARRLNALVGRLRADNPFDPADLPDDDRRKAAAMLEGIGAGWKVVDLWKRQAVAGQTRQALLGSAEGIQRIVDAQLPSAWEWDCDVVFLAGDPAGTVRRILRERGMRRLVFLAEDAPQDLRIDQQGACTTVEVAGLDRVDAALQALPRPSARQVYCLNATADIGDERWREIRQGVLDAFIAYRKDINTLGRLGMDWTLQSLRNLPLLARLPQVGAVGGAFAGLPAIVVSPGPSLDRNIAALARAKGRALIVTSAQGLPVLAAAGIDPDVVIVADHQGFLRDCLTAAAGGTGATLLASANCDPGVFEAPGFSRRMGFLANGPAEGWLSDALGDPSSASRGSSVSVMAFKLALEWGCDPVVLVGQDLAFEGGRQYAEGVDPSHLEANRAANARSPAGAAALRVPGLHGDPLPTKPDYYLFRRELAAFAEAAGGAAKLFNCTEGGAFIDGFDHRPLAPVIAEFMPEHPVPAIAGRLAALPEHGPEQRREAARAALAGMLKALDECVRSARQYGRLNGAGTAGPKRAKQLQRTEQRLKAALRRVAPLSVAAQSGMEEIMLQARRAGDGAAVERASERLVSVVLDTARRLRPAIVDAIDRL